MSDSENKGTPRLGPIIGQEIHSATEENTSPEMTVMVMALRDAALTLYRAQHKETFEETQDVATTLGYVGTTFTIPPDALDEGEELHTMGLAVFVVSDSLRNQVERFLYLLPILLQEHRQANIQEVINPVGGVN